MQPHQPQLLAKPHKHAATAARAPHPNTPCLRYGFSEPHISPLQGEELRRKQVQLLGLVGAAVPLGSIAHGLFGQVGSQIQQADDEQQRERREG